MPKRETTYQQSILIIDDDKVLNETLQCSLENEGYVLEGALDGVDGLRMLRTKKYQLILLDMRMPKKDGLEVLKLIKKEFSNLKVIVITGHLAGDDLQKIKNLGADACLQKPFRIEAIQETITQTLNN